MRAYVEIGREDIATIDRYAGNMMWKFEATEDGLTLSWGDPNARLFFTWDYVETEANTPDPVTKGKAQIQFGMGAHDETETLPGLDDDIKRWTNEAQDET